MTDKINESGPHDRAKMLRWLSAETGADQRTTGRWLDGETVTASVDYAMRAAARRLGFEGDALAFRNANPKDSAALKTG